MRIQATALNELDSIVAYLVACGPNTASAFLDEWVKMLEGMRDGVVEHRLSRLEVLAKLGYHTVLVKSYVVLYFKEGDDIVIAHVFHQSKDYANLVLEGM